jgi:hypothetical protein
VIVNYLRYPAEKPTIEGVSSLTDYYTHTIVHQSIPRRMMSPVEEFVLKQVFEWEDDPDVVGNICFFAGEYPNPYIAIDDKEELRIIADSRALSPELCDEIEKALVVDDGGIWIDDIGGYEWIFQAIVKRNQQELPYISIEQAFTCTDMHPDAFGGAGILIGPDSIESMNTMTWLEKRIADLNLNERRGEA